MKEGSLFIYEGRWIEIAKELEFKGKNDALH
jgi:hypothetical protein